MYTPTEQELIEMGFRKSLPHLDTYHLYIPTWNGGNIQDLQYLPDFEGKEIKHWLLNYTPIFPHSKSDIETLIRLFTK